MKILRLRFTNLNSLRGQWTIDFTTPPLAGAGLFAITGPTGAGKSTLLDAITLALYGRAARYGTQANPEAVMSRHTGECSAEVEFACATGSYRSVWQLRRAHKKPSGEVQPPRRKVIALPAEEILTERIDTSQAKIVELTGLDYDRFLRSVLLAQGEFAAFLKANAKERTDLLQQVTGTGIYQEISRAAYRRCEIARLAHSDLLAKNQTLPILDPEKRAELETQRVGHQSRLDELTPTLRQLAERRQQAQRQLEYDAAFRQLTTDRAAFDLEFQTSAPTLERLSQHELAAVFAPDLAGLQQQQEDRVREQKELSILEIDLPDLIARRAAAEKARQDSATALDMFLRGLEGDRKKWDAVEELDRVLTGLRESWTQITEEQTRVAQDLMRFAKTKKTALEDQEKATKEAASVEAWLNAKAAEGKIASHVAEVQSSLALWETLDRQHSETAKFFTTAQGEVAKLSSSAAAEQRKLPPLEAVLAQAETALQKATESLAVLGDQEPLPEIEKQLEAAQLRREGAERLSEKAAILRQLILRQAERNRELEGFEKALTDAQSQIVTGQKKCEDLIQLVSARQSAVNFAERFQTFAEQRSALIAGESCPLCGALDHPGADGQFTLAIEVAKAGHEHRAASEELKNAQAALTQAEKLLAGQLAERKRVSAERDRDQTEQQTQLATWTVAARELEVANLPDEEAGLTALTAKACAEEDRLKRLVASTRNAEKTERAAREAAVQCRQDLERQRQECHHRQIFVEQATDRLPQLKKALGDLARNTTGEREKFTSLTTIFGYEPVELAAATDVVRELKSRADQYRLQQDKLHQLRTELGEKNARVTALAEEEKNLRAKEAGSRDRVEAAQRLLAEQQASRREKFGDRLVTDARRDADAERERLDTAVASAQKIFGEQNLAHAQAIRRQAELAASLSRRTAEIQAKETVLVGRAVSAGFQDLAILQAALLTADAATDHLAVRRQLDERRTGLAQRVVQLEAQRAQLPASAEADALKLPELQAEIQRLEIEQAQVNQSLGGVIGNLKSDDELRLRQAGLVSEIEAAHREYARWDQLRALIGSADGSVFARFAQGLTLERLVDLANRHLDQLNPRYRIRRSTGAAADELELEIVDRYQADVTRPMRSLSGGESFLVSLALALGLSELASGATAIESLFIDEGFGTLDADTLETAMAALENLQARGKTIGVISHVPAMQERITTQIRVEKQSAGCSRIVVE